MQDKKFISLLSLRNHLKTCSGPVPSSSSSSSSDIGSNNPSTSRSEIIQSLETARRRQCVICSERVENFKVHYETKHARRNENNEHFKARLVFFCPVCNSNFSRIHTLKEHFLAIHTTERPVIRCALCPYTEFRSQEALSEHTRNEHVNIRETRHFGRFQNIGNALRGVLTSWAVSFDENEISSIEQLQVQHSIWFNASKLLHGALDKHGIIKYSLICRGRFIRTQDGEEADGVSMVLPMRTTAFSLTPENIPHLRRFLDLGLSQIDNRVDDLKLSGSQWLLQSVLSLTVEIGGVQPLIKILPAQQNNDNKPRKRKKDLQVKNCGKKQKRA